MRLHPCYHPSSTKPPYTVTGIIIHKLAASLFKPRGSKRGKKVAAYSPENTVVTKPSKKAAPSKCMDTVSYHIKRPILFFHLCTYSGEKYNICNIIYNIIYNKIYIKCSFLDFFVDILFLTVKIHLLLQL